MTSADLTLDAVLTEFSHDYGVFLSFVKSSPLHAYIFMRGYLDTSSLEKFPEKLPDHYCEILSISRLVEKIDQVENLILSEYSLARAYLAGVSLGRSTQFQVMGETELSCRAHLLVEAFFYPFQKYVFHLIFDKTSLIWLTRSHLKPSQGKCDYCLAGAPNHLGNPYAVPVSFDPKKHVIFCVSSS